MTPITSHGTQMVTGGVREVIRPMFGYGTGGHVPVVAGHGAPGGHGTGHDAFDPSAYNPLLAARRAQREAKTEEAMMLHEVNQATGFPGTVPTVVRKSQDPSIWSSLGRSGWNFLKGATVGFVGNTVKSMFCNPDGSFNLFKSIGSAALIAGAVALTVCSGGTAAPLVMGGLAALGAVTSGAGLVKNAVNVARHYANGEHELAEIESFKAGENTTGLALSAFGVSSAANALKAAQAARAATTTAAAAGSTTAAATGTTTAAAAGTSTAATAGTTTAAAAGTSTATGTAGNAAKAGSFWSDLFGTVKSSTYKDFAKSFVSSENRAQALAETRQAWSTLTSAARDTRAAASLKTAEDAVVASRTALATSLPGASLNTVTEVEAALTAAKGANNATAVADLEALLAGIKSAESAQASLTAQSNLVNLASRTNKGFTKVGIPYTPAKLPLPPARTVATFAPWAAGNPDDNMDPRTEEEKAYFSSAMDPHGMPGAHGVPGAHGAQQDVQLYA